MLRSKLEIERIYFTLDQAIEEVNNKLLTPKKATSGLLVAYIRKRYLTIPVKEVHHLRWRFTKQQVREIYEFFTLHYRYGVEANKVQLILNIVNKELL